MSRKRKKRAVETPGIEVAVPKRNPDSRPDLEPVSKPTDEPRSYRVFATALTSLALLWLSFPPVGLFWLAWIAPLPLVWLVQDEQLSGRRPYRQLYFAGLLYWLATFYFIPIPHPALWVGWIAVSIYMAVYTPMFVGISRTLIYRFQLPGLLVVPVVWTGIEWIRCNFATGMAMACLSHTQYKIPILIQVADLFGAYTLTFVMMLCVVGVSTVIKIVLSRGKATDRASTASQLASVVVSCLVLAAVLLYGQYRLNEPIRTKGDYSLKIALIQSSNDVVFRALSEDEWMTQLVEKYKLTWQAREQWDDLDLIVWPESGFNPYVDLVSDVDLERTVEAVANVRTQVWSDAVGYPDHFPTPIPLLTGGGTVNPDSDESFASAFLIANDGQIETRYYKNHLVMIGEYVPLADWIPIIEQLSPIGAGVTAGTKFEIITRNDINIAPSICFETTIPHFIRRQINTLAESGTEPDAMVNMTNDGWFYGTSCLDLHLACNVFRAVEMRKPHLVCANTGLSAEIDSCGRVLQMGPRQKTTVIRAEIKPIQRSSLYRSWGDLIPMLFAAIVLLAGLFGWFKK